MISFTRYVQITSGVGAGLAVRLRDLILRLFSTSPLVPIDGVVEFTSAADVGTYFGLTSPEYLRAVFYFGFISKRSTAPKRMSFARYADVASAARVYGSAANRAVSSFTPVTTGSIKLTIGAYTQDLTGINFSAATTLSNVASILQTAIQAIVAGGAAWTAATVTYNAVARRFELVGGTVGASPVAVAAAATGTPIAGLLGWDASAIYSPGVAVEQPLAAFVRSAEGNDNFGTFAFVPSLTLSQITEVAAQNKTYNVKFMYLVPVLAADVNATFAALQGFAGSGVSLSPLTTEYPELLPASVAAATDYTQRDATVNYMFQQAALTPSISSNAQADTMDSNRTNYYGRTQTAGQFLDFYQRGILMGLATDPVDMNTYVNEMWLKDAAGARLMELMLNARVPANAKGRAMMLAQMQDVVDRGTFNGVISVGKPLSVTQKLYITNVTGDPLAWQQVLRIGYWMDGVMQSIVNPQTQLAEWQFVYTLIYSKDDAVRKVVGTHTLI